MKKTDAFVSIEYSLLLPGILAVFTMIICMGLYLYNQCILQTNVYLLAVEGARLYAEDNQQKLILLQKKEQELYAKKYILTENMQTVYNLKGNNITINGSGTMTNPFSVYGMGDKVWKLGAESKVGVYSPGERLRLMKNALKLLDDTELKEEGEDDS